MFHLDDLDADPILIPHHGRLAWLWPSGRILPDVSGGAEDPPEKVFTQADVDRIVQDRLSRVKPVEVTPADYDDLKTKAAELETLKSKDQSELQQTQAERDKLAAERDTAKAERDAAVETSKTLKLRSAVIAVAVREKAVDPDDVFALLPKDAVTIGDDGQVTGAEDAVKTLLAAKPHLVGQAQKPKPDPAQGPRPGTGPSVAAGREMFEARRKPASANAS